MVSHFELSFTERQIFKNHLAHFIIYLNGIFTTAMLAS